MEPSLPLGILYSARLELSFLLKQQFQMVTFEDPDQVQAIRLEMKHVLGSFDRGESLRAAPQIWGFYYPL